MKREAQFKRVPALDKCFNILEFLAGSTRPVGVSGLSRATGYHRSAVFNMLKTLADLHVLSKKPDKKYDFGLQLYFLGRAVSDGAELIGTIHPYLVQINRKTGLSICLGIRAGAKAVIVDEVDSDLTMKISMDAGTEVPVTFGAGGKALLSLLPDAEIERILAEHPLEEFSPLTGANRARFKEKVEKIRTDGFAFDQEEYMDGICTLAVPLNLGKRKIQAAIWAVGLKRQFKGSAIDEYATVLKEAAGSIAVKFALL